MMLSFMLSFFLVIYGGILGKESSATASHSARMIRLSLWSAGLAIAGSAADRAGRLAGSVRPIVALVPVVPLIAFFVRITRWLRSLNELQRAIHLEAMVTQFAATGILVMSYGMLARSGAVPNVSATTAFPVLWVAMLCFWSVGIVWVRRKYQ